MDEKKYKIIFKGDVVPGRDPETAKQNLAKLYHVDVNKVESLFSGKLFVLKEDISLDEAQKHMFHLEEAGVVCEIAEMPVVLENQAVEPAEPSASEPEPEPEPPQPPERMEQVELPEPVPESPQPPERMEQVELPEQPEPVPEPPEPPEPLERMEHVEQPEQPEPTEPLELHEQVEQPEPVPEPPQPPERLEQVELPEPPQPPGPLEPMEQVKPPEPSEQLEQALPGPALGQKPPPMPTPPPMPQQQFTFRKAPRKTSSSLPLLFLIVVVVAVVIVIFKPFSTQKQITGPAVSPSEDQSSEPSPSPITPERPAQRTAPALSPDLTEPYNEPNGYYSISLPAGYKAIPKPLGDQGETEVSFMYADKAIVTISTAPRETEWEPQQAMMQKVTAIQTGNDRFFSNYRISEYQLVNIRSLRGYEVLLEMGDRVAHVFGLVSTTDIIFTIKIISFGQDNLDILVSAVQDNLVVY